MYDDGASETILGEALRGHRDESCWPPRSATRWAATCSAAACRARWIMQACDDSLRRLQVDHIDLYQMHRPDPRRRSTRRCRVRRTGARRQGARHRHVHVLARADRRGARARGRGSAPCGRPASSRRTRRSHVASRPKCCRRANAQHGRAGVGAAQRRLADRQVPGRGRRRRLACDAPTRPLRPRPTRQSAPRSTRWSRRLTEVAADAGMSLKQLALALRARRPDASPPHSSARARSPSWTTCSRLAARAAGTASASRSMRSSRPAATSTPPTPAERAPTRQASWSQHRVLGLVGQAANGR